MKVLTAIRDRILVCLNLPTPDLLSRYKWEAEFYSQQLDVSRANKEGARYETPWKLTKDGTRLYRKVAVKMVVNKWTTESRPYDSQAEHLHKLQMEEDGVQIVWE